MGMKVFPIADAFRLFCNDKVQWRARCPVVRAGSFHTATLLTATTTNARGLTVLVTDVIIIGSVSYYGARCLAPSLAPLSIRSLPSLSESRAMPFAQSLASQIITRNSP